VNWFAIQVKFKGFVSIRRRRVVDMLGVKKSQCEEKPVGRKASGATEEARNILIQTFFWKKPP
jgi:hypothetical protein